MSTVHTACGYSPCTLLEWRQGFISWINKIQGVKKHGTFHGDSHGTFHGDSHEESPVVIMIIEGITVMLISAFGYELGLDNGALLITLLSAVELLSIC